MTVLMPLNCTLKNAYKGIFNVLYKWPQFKSHLSDINDLNLLSYLLSYLSNFACVVYPHAASSTIEKTNTPLFGQ